MCGIVGYVGKKASAPVLIEGLRRLEYRGYDSAGLAVLNCAGIQLRKRMGRIDQGLARLLEQEPVAGQLGIGHTRWATHGPPSDMNSHPHLDQSGKIALVHNGVIENCDRLRARLLRSGHQFVSGTDTEVLAHLIGEHYEKLRAAPDGASQAQGSAVGKGFESARPPAQPCSDSEREHSCPQPLQNGKQPATLHPNSPNSAADKNVQVAEKAPDAVGTGEGSGRAGPSRPMNEAEAVLWASKGSPAPPVAGALPGNWKHVLTKAVCEALREVMGTYGVAVMSADHPGMLVGARRGSPLIVGIGQGENFLASDANAIVAYTREVVFLNDYDVVTVTPDAFEVMNLGVDTARVQISKLEYGAEDAAQGEYAHFMLKEIFEQPRAVENALRGRVDMEGATARFGGLNMSTADLRGMDHVVIAASGTSWHAALVGEYLLEGVAHLPVEVQFAHEFCYRNAPMDRDTVLLAISQSGETADTLAALREAKRRGHRALAIVNVVGSTVAREADGGIYMHAGPEIGVASTKAFISTLTVLTLLAVHLGRMRMLSAPQALEVLRALEEVPGQLEAILGQNDALKALALKYARADDFFFLARGYSYPIALEGALKLKEISYIHAEGYSAAEMKHGPIALIDPKTPALFVVPQDSMYDKTMANLAMIRARKGPVIALASEGDRRIAEVADDVFYLPKTIEPIYPILAAVPLQLLAYHIAVARGCDVDKPRNLAKSVTVE